MLNLTLAQVAEQLGAEIVGDPLVLLSGFAPADRARPGDLTFAENANYFAQAEKSGAAAILVGPEIAASAKPLLRVKNPRVAFAKVLPLFFPETPPLGGIHPTAVVAASALIAATAHIGPHCVIGERVTIGARTALLGGNHIGDDAQLGSDVRLYQNVVLYPKTQLGNRVRIHAGSVIGSDGFGYVFDEGQHRKIQQIGNVVIHDDVEIGANTCIDRGALDSTVIGRGAKIDNLVQVAHNVTIGEGCLVVAQVGIAGSSTLGKFAVLAGQAGIAGHLKLGNQVTVAGQSGVMNDIPDGEKWLGTPAGRDREVKRQWAALRHLPEALRRLSELEKELAQLRTAARKD